MSDIIQNAKMAAMLMDVVCNLEELTSQLFGIIYRLF